MEINNFMMTREEVNLDADFKIVEGTPLTFIN